MDHCSSVNTLADELTEARLQRILDAVSGRICTLAQRKHSDGISGYEVEMIAEALDRCQGTQEVEISDALLEAAYDGVLTFSRTRSDHKLGEFYARYTVPDMATRLSEER